MIEGTVNANLEAIVPLSLRGPEGQVREVDVVIDTGYSGSLTLPPAPVAELELPYVFSSKATLADDTEDSFRVHGVTALWDSRPQRIEADAVGSTPLLSMALLESHSLLVGLTLSATTLDRVHTTILLQAAGRSQVLRNLLRAKQERGPDFLRLANALIALYLHGSKENGLGRHAASRAKMRRHLPKWIA